MKFKDFLKLAPSGSGLFHHHPTNPRISAGSASGTGSGFHNTFPVVTFHKIEAVLEDDQNLYYQVGS